MTSDFKVFIGDVRPKNTVLGDIRVQNIWFLVTSDLILVTSHFKTFGDMRLSSFSLTSGVIFGDVRLSNKWGFSDIRV